MHRRRFFGVLAGAVAAIAIQLDPPQPDWEKELQKASSRRLARLRCRVLTAIPPYYRNGNNLLFGGQYVGWEGSEIYRWEPQSSDPSLPAA